MKEKRKPECERTHARTCVWDTAVCSAEAEAEGEAESETRIRIPGGMRIPLLAGWLTRHGWVGGRMDGWMDGYSAA